MTKLLKRIFLLVILSLHITLLHAQSVRKIAIRHKLSTEFGLSSYNVNKILQDGYGYMWLATQDGLNRYDGRTFSIYNRSSDPRHRLLGNVINDMVLDSARQMLWVTTSYGGLNGIDLLTGNVVHSMKSSLFKDKFPSEWLKCLNIAAGKLWIGSLFGLQVYDPEKRTFVKVERLPSTAVPKDFSENVSVIQPDQYGNVWVSMPDYGLLVYAADGKLKKHHKAVDLGTNQTLSFLQFSSRFIHWSKNQFLWATDKGFRLLTYDEDGNITSANANISINKDFRNRTIFSCAKDLQGNLWFSTFEHLYVWYPANNKYEVIEDIVYTPTNDYLNTVMHIFFDNEDNLWLGTQYGAGVCDYQQPAIVPYYRDRKSDVQINHAFFVLPATDSTIYVAAQHGAFVVNQKSGNISQLSGARRFNFMFKTPHNEFVFSNDEGLQVLSNGKLAPITNRFPELAAIKDQMINSTVNCGDSLIILSSEKNNHVYKWNMRNKTVSAFPFPLKDGEQSIINTLFLDRNNTLWMLFDNIVATHNLTNGKSATIALKDPALDIPMNIYMDMCELKNDYWLALYGRGVVRMGKDGAIKKIYGQEQGLANTGTYTVLPYRDSLLFVTTNFGMFTIDPATETVRQYLMTDGLNTNNFEENCAVVWGDNILAGGEQGVSVIRPTFFRERNHTERIYINHIVTEKEDGVADTFNLFLNKFRINNDVKQATIYFSAPDYAHPEKIKYSYRIPELSDGWTTLATQNFISLVGLAPGSYELEVKAINETGAESSTSTIELDVQPKWYQTLVFKICVVLLVAAILYGIYRYRVAQIRKQEQMRRDIATDLHDDIGSTLNSAKIFAHLAKREENSTSNLDLVEQTLTDASVGLRDIIWLLDDTRDKYSDFVDRINRFAQPITAAKGITLKSIMDPDFGDRELDKTVKKTFFLIAKEAINNSIKHSNSDTITYEIKPDGAAHMLIVTDNGKGFDTTRSDSGNGLGNMRYRAEKIGYAVEMISSPGNGVRLTLKKR